MASQSSTYFRLSSTKLAIFTLSMPILATLFCVIWSLIFDFKSSTRTHCRVPNYLPSISSAIGGYTPQKYVWRVCIAIHSFPRFLYATFYYNFYSQVHAGKNSSIYRILVLICVLLHVIENLALIMLTYVSSTENFSIHENSFIAFMVTSQLYMVLTCILFRWSRQIGGRTLTTKESKSLKYKICSMIFNIATFLLAVYLYFRHNWYCEPWMYTGFAFFEYLTVFSNKFFHGTAIIDFCDYTLSLSLTDLILQPATRKTQ